MNNYKFLNTILNLLLYIPILFIISFYFFVYRAYLTINHLPFYGNPDPKELNFHIHYLTVVILFILIIPSIVFSIIIFRYLSLKNKFTLKKWKLFIFILGIMLFLLFNRFDIQFVEWFID